MTIFASPNSFCSKQEEKFSTLREKFYLRLKKDGIRKNVSILEEYKNEIHVLK